MKKTTKVKSKVTRPVLFKIETGKTPPINPRRTSVQLQKIKKALTKMKVGDSFLILTGQVSSVRNMIKDGAAALKKYKIRISKAEEGNDYRRVFRLEDKKPKTDKK
jgi:TusA-related sulfurtransferase